MRTFQNWWKTSTYIVKKLSDNGRKKNRKKSHIDLLQSMVKSGYEEWLSTQKEKDTLHTRKLETKYCWPLSRNKID